MLGYPDITKGIKKRPQALGDDWTILLHLDPFCQAFIAKIRFELFTIVVFGRPTELFNWVITLHGLLVDQKSNMMSSLGYHLVL